MTSRHLNNPISSNCFDVLEWVCIGQNNFGYSATIPENHPQPVVTIPAGTITNGEILLLVRKQANVHLKILESGKFEVCP